MNKMSGTKINQKYRFSITYQSIQMIQSVKDFKFLKPIENVKKYAQQFLLSTVEKLLILTEQNCQNIQIFISPQPYLKTNGKFVFLFSDKNSFGKLLTKHDSTILGTSIISILKNIYNELYAQDQSFSKDFKTLVQFVIDNETKISQNLYKSHQIREILQSSTFIIKNNLQIRIQKALILNVLIFKLQQKKYFQELIWDSLNKFNSSLNKKMETCSSLRCLQKFLILCTKANILIYPAKKTIDSNFKTDSFEDQQHFAVNFITKQVQNFHFNEKSQSSDYFDGKKVSQLTQMMFSFTKISQKNETYLLVQLQSDFYMTQPCFLYFEEFYRSVIEKYSQIYLDLGYESCFEQNLNNAKLFLRAKDSTVCLGYKLRTNRRQSIINDFIKTIDVILIIYLVFQDLLIKYQDEAYFETFNSQQYRVQKRQIQEQLSKILSQQIKKYLQALTLFKRNLLSSSYS